MAKCAICGKGLSRLFEQKNLGDLIRSSTLKDNIQCRELFKNLICQDCYSILYKATFAADLQKGRECISEKKETAREYFENKSTIQQLINNTPNEMIKDELLYLLENADECCEVYYQYDDILFSAKKKITYECALLPSKRLDCGTYTISSDQNSLYLMQYGNPLCDTQKLTEIQNHDERLSIINELSKNVIDASSLVKKIPLENILYYQERGDINYSTSVSGGGGGGASIGGAVIGGLLFGVAGAVVGGMTGNKTDAVKSEAIKHDDRYVVFRYVENGQTYEEKYDYVFLDVFNKLIPEKEYSFIQLQKESTVDQKQQSSYTPIPVEELKKLKELLDIGVITKEDFDAKKKQLLGI